MILGLALAVFAGAVVQRVSGIGFALVASPFLVFLIGPVHGVLLVNLLAAIVSFAILCTSWRNVERRRAMLLVPAGLVGVLPGVVAVNLLSAGALQVSVGATVAAALLATSVSPRINFDPTPSRTIGLGVVSGFMTAAAGVGGPALTVYAMATNWRQEAFAATSQISFGSQAILALALKGLPRLPTPQLVVLIMAVACGLALGHVLARRLTAPRVRQAAISIAFVGVAATIAKGVLIW